MQPSFLPLPLLPYPEPPSKTNTRNTPYPITRVVPSAPTKPTCWVTAQRKRSSQTKKGQQQGGEIYHLPPPQAMTAPSSEVSSENDSDPTKKEDGFAERGWEAGRTMCVYVQGPVHHMTVKEDQSRRGVREEKGGKGAIAMATAPTPPSRLPKREEELQIPTVSARAAPS